MRALTPICLALVLGGCSAIVDPDGSRLGGGVDGGGVDGGSVDASTDGATDSGSDTGVDAPDAPELCPGGCDDGVPCTVDRCDAGRCISTPNEGLCGVDERCAPMIGCVPERCSRDEECNDGLPCNGDEVCNGADPTTGCGDGVPLDCSDAFDCTVDACADAAGGCVHEERDAACDDFIDCTTDTCSTATGCSNARDDSFCDDGLCRMGGVCDPSRGCIGSIDRDCGDGDPCTSDTCDPATGCVNDPRDDDMDGFPSDFEGRVCGGGTDCDDGNPLVNPGATEICNGIDDNCDGAIDEGMVCPELPDDCSTAAPILFTGSTGSVTARFGSFTHDYSTLCTDGSSRDAVYYIDVPRGTFDVVIDTLGSITDTVIAVSESCGDWDYAGHGCSDDIDFGAITQSRIWMHRFGSSFDTTRLYILIEPFGDGEVRSFTLNVTLQDASADACSGNLSINAGGTVVGHGSLTGLGGQTGSCQPSSEFIAGESVFRFSATANSSFNAWSTGFVPTLYVRDTCNRSDSEVDCRRGMSVGGGVNEVSLDVTSGSFVFLDGQNSGGAYTLTYDP